MKTTYTQTIGDSPELCCESITPTDSWETRIDATFDKWYHRISELLDTHDSKNKEPVAERFVEIPVFYGDDDLRPWMDWMENRFAYEDFTDDQKMAMACGFIRGDAESWYYKQISRFPFLEWDDLKRAMLIQFGNLGDPERINICLDIKRWLYEEESQATSGETSNSVAAMESLDMKAEIISNSVFLATEVIDTKSSTQTIEVVNDGVIQRMGEDDEELQKPRAFVSLETELLKRQMIPEEEELDSHEPTTSTLPSDCVPAPALVENSFVEDLSSVVWVSSEDSVNQFQSYSGLVVDTLSLGSDSGRLYAHQDEAIYTLTSSEIEDLVQTSTCVKEKLHVQKLFVPVLRRVQGKKKKQKYQKRWKFKFKKRSWERVFFQELFDELSVGFGCGSLWERVELLTRPIYVTMRRFAHQLFNKMFLDLRREKIQNVQRKLQKSWRFKFRRRPGLHLQRTLADNPLLWHGSEAVETLSQFGFGIVQLCLMSNIVTWRRHETDSFEPVSACRQWSGLSSEFWDTDLWSRHSGTMTEAYGAVRTAVVMSENHMLLLLSNLWRQSCVKGCLATQGSSNDWLFCPLTADTSSWCTRATTGSMSQFMPLDKDGADTDLWLQLDKDMFREKFHLKHRWKSKVLHQKLMIYWKKIKERDGFANAETTRCKLDAVWTDGVGMLLQEREVVYKLDLKATHVRMVEQVSSEQMLQSQVQKQQRKRKFMKCWMFKYRETNIQLVFLELLEVDSQAVAVMSSKRHLHQLTMACYRCDYHKLIFLSEPSQEEHNDQLESADCGVTNPQSYELKQCSYSAAVIMVLQNNNTTYGTAKILVLALESVTRTGYKAA
ncbi:uncharacterized protein LOC117133005 [Brassica rapa]|uniref:uncharacterized protein LOC117133005 n=1 Tax=Brassica campestris TaxID=3711 RepID=UPI00142D7AE3|nr:uncharacterized protein LOC117133005 [Brassica rapa]